MQLFQKKRENILASRIIVLPLQRKKAQEHSSVGLERFSHIEEVIGSSPIVPTKARRCLAFVFFGGMGFFLRAGAPAVPWYNIAGGGARGPLV